jgi:hypothetical protein
MTNTKKLSMKTKLLLCGIVFIFFSCGSNNQNAKNEEKGKTDSAVKTGATAVNTPKINTDSLIKVIDLERERIETNVKSFQRTTLPTAKLREQIKQKWQKIDFYTQKEQIVRIKSYPYEKISHRTEEFYFKNGILMLGFIEDNGLNSTGKSEQREGKTYYFFGDVVIKEENLSNEKETSIRTSDGERLLQEAKEYLELFPKK